jgi:hypothetical protein
LTSQSTAPRSEPVTPALWLARLCGALFVALSIVWTFQVASRLGYSVYKEQFLLLCLGLAGAIVYLTNRVTRILLGLGGLAAVFPDTAIGASGFVDIVGISPQQSSAANILSRACRRQDRFVRHRRRKLAGSWEL